MLHVLEIIFLLSVQCVWVRVRESLVVMYTHTIYEHRNVQMKTEYRIKLSNNFPSVLICGRQHSLNLCAKQMTTNVYNWMSVCVCCVCVSVCFGTHSVWNELLHKLYRQKEKILSLFGLQWRLNHIKNLKLMFCSGFFFVRSHRQPKYINRLKVYQKNSTQTNHQME